MLEEEPYCALITGAAKGIGAAIAKKLAAQGYPVCINYRQSEQAAMALRDMICASGGQACVVRADVSDESDVKKMFAWVAQHFYPVGVLVNNAGADFGRKSLIELDANFLLTVLQNNVVSCFLCAKEAVQQMKKLGHGVIVNISSESAEHGSYRLSHYAASKSGVNALTKSLARELAEDQIRINAVSPGMICAEGESDQVDPTAARPIPLGRKGQGEDVANVVAWMCSPESGYLTGSIIRVHGGQQ